MYTSIYIYISHVYIYIYITRGCISAVRDPGAAAVYRYVNNYPYQSNIHIYVYILTYINPLLLRGGFG